MSEPQIVDDAGGLYSHVSDAFTEGCKSGARDAALAIRAGISPLYVRHERDEDPAMFHALGEALRVISTYLESLDRPKHDPTPQATDSGVDLDPPMKRI